MLSERRPPVTSTEIQNQSGSSNLAKLAQGVEELADLFAGQAVILQAVVAASVWRAAVSEEVGQGHAGRRHACDLERYG